MLEKTEKLTPRPSHVAPSGQAAPRSTRSAARGRRARRTTGLLSVVVIGVGMRLLRKRTPRAQHLRHAPCLCDTAARRVRELGVENLADGAHAGRAQLANKAGEK